MTVTRRILSGELGDPTSWAGVPENFAPHNAIYLDARLIDVALTNRDLVITLRYGENTFGATLSDDSFKEGTATALLIRTKVFRNATPTYACPNMRDLFPHTLKLHKPVEPADSV